MGLQDLKACIDYIQKSKGDYDKISLIGHSQGTTIATYAMAEDPEYFHKRINLFVALAPSIFF